MSTTLNITQFEDSIKDDISQVSLNNQWYTSNITLHQHTIIVVSTKMPTINTQKDNTTKHSSSQRTMHNFQQMQFHYPRTRFQIQPHLNIKSLAQDKLNKLA